MYPISVKRILYALWLILLFTAGLTVVYKMYACDIVKAVQETTGSLPYDDINAGAKE